MMRASTGIAMPRGFTLASGFSDLNGAYRRVRRIAHAASSPVAAGADAGAPRLRPYQIRSSGTLKRL